MQFNVTFKKPSSPSPADSQAIENTVVTSDFIPYACHYDAETLLTKNGELMQTIKIVGFSFESVENEGIDLRETIREAIHQGIETNNFALWFHTIRRRKNLNAGGTYTDPFARHVHESWIERHDWEHKYINELFITVVREGETGSIRTPKRFMRSLLFNKDNDERIAHLKDMHAELCAVTDRMLDALSVYGAHKLGIYSNQGTYYSEPLMFLSKIVKLHEEPVPLREADVSKVLATHDVTFGFDTLEVRSPEGNRRYGTVLTIKEYRELSLAAIDEFLQLPEEFIVTQCMDFINTKKALKEFKFQHNITQLSQDRDLARLSGLQEIVESDQGRPTDYGEQQLTIFLVADDLKHLGRYVERTMDALSHLGIVAMREDLKMEECYWAQLPGNFPFLTRLRPINTARIGGFANLSNFPAGKRDSNHWGSAVTVFNTAASTPYFFNFHISNVGHTSIIGPYGSGKTILLNFLLCEARKFNNKLFFFDNGRGSEIFLRALGGNYTTPSPRQGEIKLNPLQLEDNAINRDFLLLWIEAMVCGDRALSFSPSQDAIVESALGTLLSYPKQERHLKNLAALISRQDKGLGDALDLWHSSGTYAALFDHAEDTLDMDNPIHGFEMGEIVANPYTAAATLLYLLHRIMMELDGSTPAIIVLDEAWELLDNPIFAPRLHAWLQALTHKNALAIFATESPEAAGQSAVSEIMFSDIVTQIYLPNPEPVNAYQTVFGLNETEFSFLSLMDSEQRHFLLKKGGEAIVAELSLDGLEHIMAVLSSTPETLSIMRQAIAERGTAPKDWAPLFMERISTPHA